MRKATIIAAIITSVALIVAALIGIFPSFRDHKMIPESVVVAGIVVNQDTNHGIGQAIITIAGRTEQYVTEDSGNFRIDLRTASSLFACTSLRAVLNRLTPA